MFEYYCSIYIIKRKTWYHIYYNIITLHTFLTSGGGFFRSAFKRRMENTTRSSFFFPWHPTRLSTIDDPWGPRGWIPLAPGRCRAFWFGGKMVLDLVTVCATKNDRDKHPSWIKGVEVSGWKIWKHQTTRVSWKETKWEVWLKVPDVGSSHIDSFVYAVSLYTTGWWNFKVFFWIFWCQSLGKKKPFWPISFERVAHAPPFVWTKQPVLFDINL